MLTDQPFLLAIVLNDPLDLILWDKWYELIKRFLAINQGNKILANIRLRKDVPDELVLGLQHVRLEDIREKLSLLLIRNMLLTSFLTNKASKRQWLCFIYDCFKFYFST